GSGATDPAPRGAAEPPPAPRARHPVERGRCQRARRHPDPALRPEPAADPRRRGPAAAGLPQSRPQWPGRHGTRRAPDPDDAREPEPALRQDGPRRGPAQHGRGAGRRRGPGDSGRRPLANLRSVLHDQGQGSRARALDLPPHSRGAPRRDPGGQRRGTRNERDVLPADREVERMKARILVADDEDSLRWVLEKGLRQAGYEVSAVKDGTAAVGAFETEPFDLVLDRKSTRLNSSHVSISYAVFCLKKKNKNHKKK